MSMSNNKGCVAAKRNGASNHAVNKCMHPTSLRDVGDACPWTAIALPQIPRTITTTRKGYDSSPPQSRLHRVGDLIVRCVPAGSPLCASASWRLCDDSRAGPNAETQRRGGAEMGLAGNRHACCHDPFLGGYGCFGVRDAAGQGRQLDGKLRHVGTAARLSRYAEQVMRWFLAPFGV
jgi:hypothetical protein